MRKRGQVTLFVVLGVVILAVVIIAINFRSEISDMTSKISLEEEKMLSEEEQNVKSSVESCLKKKTIEALVIASNQGGLIYAKPDEMVLFYTYIVPLYKRFPSLAAVEKDIASYIDIETESCMYEGGYNLSYGESKSVAKIKSGAVDVVMGWPVSFGVNGSRRLNKFHASVPVDFFSVYGEVKSAYESLVAEEGTFFDIAYNAQEEGYSILSETRENVTFYVFNFENITLDNNNLTFIFGMAQEFAAVNVSEDLGGIELE